MRVKKGYKVEGVEMMLFVNRISEILKDVGQQENVRKKVVIVMQSHTRCARLSDWWPLWRLHLRRRGRGGEEGLEVTNQIERETKPSRFVVKIQNVFFWVLGIGILNVLRWMALTVGDVAF